MITKVRMEGNHIRRRLCHSLYIARLYVRALFREAWELFCPEVDPAEQTAAQPDPSRFFYIVVEIPADNKALVRLMKVKPSVAAAIQLPPGCQFRTCFEMDAPRARMVINL